VKPSRDTYYKTRYFGDDDNLDGFSRVTAVYVNP
jgi:hypothetical protein